MGKGSSSRPPSRLQNSGFTSPFPSLTCRMSLTLCALHILFPGKLLTFLRWDSWTDHPMWLISRIAKLLRRLPRLCEFSLIMYKSSKEFHHLVGCVVKFHNLRKLSFNSIRPDTGTSFSVAKIIAANPNLTHLEVFYDAALFDEILYDDPSEYLAHTLRHLPADPPLKLEHLRLSRCFHNLAALAPHISSLTSIDIANSEILNEFLKQNIFPPTMTFRMMDQYTINYLNRHPRIVSLTNHGCNDASTCSALLGILSRHSETLTHLGFCHSVLYNCIDQTQNELAILQCTNLKQLLLDYQCNPYRRMAVSELQRVSLTRTAHLITYRTQRQQEKTLSVISRLPDTLTLVVNEKVACAACSRFCSRSQNPLLRDLARRIVL
jgi:hypothetical protein